MAKVTLILGSARSSRTALIDQRFRDRYNEALLLLPSRADVRHRQDSYVRLHDRPGIWGKRLIDFATFAESLLATSQARVRRVSHLERRLLLERAIQTKRDEILALLEVDVSALPGFATHLLSIIMQLKQAAVEPEAFQDALRKHGAEISLDRAVALVYAEYQQLLLGQGKYDVPGLYWAAEAQCAAQLPPLLSKTRLLLLDQFDDFTPSELRLLKCVAERVPELVIGLHLDTRPSRRDAFEAPLRGLQRIRDTFGNDLVWEECPDPEPKDEVSFVSEHLFWRDTPPSDANFAPGVHIVPCIDTRHEAESTARAVRAMLDAGVSPSDLAIATRERGAPLTILLHSLRAAGVPVRGMGREPLSASPVGATLLRFFEMLPTWERECVLDLLTSSCVWGGESSTARECFAFLVRKANILAGQREWEEQLAALAQLIQGKSRRAQLIRRRLDALEADLAKLTGRFVALKNQAAAFQSSASQADFARQCMLLLEAWDAGAAPDAEATRMLWSTLRLLESMAPAEAMSLSDFASVLGRAMGDVEIPRPFGSSGVTVAAPENLRNQSWRHLFVMGVNEGSYPRPSALNALYGRRELQRLESAGLRLEGSDIHAARERLLFLRLLLETRESVTLSWRLKKEGDREAMPSPYITEIEELLRARPGVRHRAPAAEAIVPRPESVTHLREAANAAAMLAGLSAPVLAQHLPAVARGGEIERERWRVAPCGVYDGVLEAEPVLEHLAAHYNETHAFSAAQLETWIGCPFQFFQDRVLGIDESTPFEGEFDPRTRGSLLHAVLSRFHARHRGAPLGSISREQAQEWMKEDTDAVFAPLFSRGGGLPVEAVRAERLYLGGMLKRYLAHAFAEDTGDWCPEAFEIPFGNAHPEENAENASTVKFAPYALRLPDGEVVLIDGRIDRVDLSPERQRARVIDYKSGRVPDAADIYSGRSLQLSIYALAVTEVLFPQVPCTEAHYVPVGRDAWREALGLEPKRDADKWAARDQNARFMAQQAIHAMRSGTFPPLPTTKSCFGCASAKACRRSESRQLRKSTKAV